jgi:NADH-quinone oxidoreductase subunit L
MHDLFQWAWLIPALPFLSFLLIAFVTKRSKGLSSTISILAILAALGLAIAIVLGILHSGAEIVEHPVITNVNWLTIGDLKINFGTVVDPLSAMMLFVVTLVASMVQIYSLGYMHGDKGWSRYYAYQSLFAFSMLGMVIATNLLQLFIFWELVGLCSYLLIGFWYFKVSAREAAKKAFITTRVGDFGLLLGILFLYNKFGTLDFAALSAVLSANLQNIAVVGTAGYVTFVAFLLFMGPMGKSGQFPLHVWLPDAMEGPTPVSALIHAATMVVAGVYLVARMYFLFHASPAALEFIGGLGAFTAIFAASIAIAQDDIKRILAYSTLSQLGYMMFALGVGSFSGSMFHLMTHAFFKALMFLGAGSVIHALHEKQNIWDMGGLWKKMPITGWTFFIGVLAISGIPPFAGFWSKDELLANALQNGHPVIYAVGLFTAFLTAFYMCRLFFVAFMGPEKSENHPHESPWTMTIPLIILAIFSTVGGLAALPAHNFNFFIHFGEYERETMNWGLAGVSVIFGLAGIGLAYLIYVKQAISAENIVARFPGIYKLLKNKYYIDELYLWLIHNIMDGVVAKFLYWFDIYIVDGVVNGVAFITRGSAKALRKTSTGQLQTYAMVFFLAIVVIFIVFAVGESQLGSLNPLAMLGGVK